jgi:ABC-2 type transport system ATP-binding protein
METKSGSILGELLLNLNQKLDTTILISSHNLYHIAQICTRISILENGKIVKDTMKSNKTLEELESYFYGE